MVVILGQQQQVVKLGVTRPPMVGHGVNTPKQQYPCNTAMGVTTTKHQATQLDATIPPMHVQTNLWFTQSVALLSCRHKS